MQASVAAAERAAEATGRTAEAAVTSAEHLPRVERAYMFATPKKTTYDDPIGTVKVIMGAKNFGKTPGILKETWGQFLTELPTGLPEHFPFQQSDKWVTDIVYAAGEEHDMADAPFTGLKRSPLFFVGYLKYQTMFRDAPHFSYWCIEATLVDNVRNEWVITDAPGWNAWS
jgi:hypothetical protein